jgi:hypothetical protein
VREAFLRDERLVAVEMLVTSEMAVIVAARRSWQPVSAGVLVAAA